MAKKKKEKAKPLGADERLPDAPQIREDPEPDETAAAGQPPASGDDEHAVFLRVRAAYEEAERKREKYKKFGPLFVLISGVVFLTLIFTLENKITFLIFWVVTILYTVALMIRAEYRYHQFREYLGMTDEEKDETEAEAPQPDASDEAEPPETEQEEQT